MDNIVNLDKSIELPKYVCHKEVGALKILGISLDGELGFEGGQFKLMSREWLDKHNPEVGGYYIVYKDGYESFSPAQAFEEGYSLIK